MTTNQHYVPQFLVKNFASDKEKNKVNVFNKMYYKFETKSISRFPSEKYFYEVKNKDGTFYNFNDIEKDLSALENQISPKVKALLPICSISSVIPTNVIDMDTCAVLHMLVTLQSLRSKEQWDKISKLCNGDENLFNIIKETFFLSDISAVQYMEHNNISCTPETRKALREIVTLNNFYFENAYKFLPYCIVAPNGYSFMCSDNPVVNTHYKGIYAVLPISPKVAICLCPKEHADREGYYGRICPCSSKLVETINEAIFEKGKIIIYNKENHSQLSQLIKKTES